MTAATRGQPDRGDKTAGRRGASGARPMERGQTARQPRNIQQQKRRASGGKTEREGGERDTDGLAPGEWRRGTRRSTAAGREQREIRQTEVKKRDINI